MNLYDIRKQIKRENKLKFVGDLCMILFLMVILCCVVIGSKIKNPFHVLQVSSKDEIEYEYKKGTDYVHVDNATLKFTGYYKENKQGHIVYNCYATIIGSERYFVFVPPEKSGADATKPDEEITDYSFTARMHKDSNLIKMVATDYDMTVDEWNQSNRISEVVLDEANTLRTRMFIVWGALGCIIIICLIYVAVAYWNLQNVYKRREIEYLSKYGDIDKILDEINDEVEHMLEFDSVHIKITKNYILCFTNGKIFIDKKSSLSEVQVVSKVKKVYGIVKLGYERYLQIMRNQLIVFELPIEEKVEADEIISLLQDSKYLEE